MKYNPNSVYKRVDNVLYQDDIAIYKLHSTFPDWNPLTEQGAKYMERFIEMNPTWVEYLLNPCKKIEVRDEMPQCRTIMVEQITLPEPDANGEVDYSKSTSKVVKATISVVPIYEVKLNVEQITSDATLSRLDQVKACMSRGVTSPSAIAKEIGANASYVQRLVSQIKQKA
jgi:hypothetical protein